jgi:hypothetical protein
VNDDRFSASNAATTGATLMNSAKKKIHRKLRLNEIFIIDCVSFEELLDVDIVMKGGKVDKD